MTTDSIADADTVVLIHGLWMTPRAGALAPRYEHRGYRVIAPAYPGFEVEVEALRDDPAPIEAVTVPDTLEHLEGIISELENPPILIGHSFGGALVQILPGRGGHRDRLRADGRWADAAGVPDPGHLPRAA
jgi:pimeloyl-ACP methyl ester carboxylesterase